jgi:hemolysin activation/secretion protein
LSWIHRIALATVLSWQAACFAQDSAQDSAQGSAQAPRFPITRFAVDGATLMTSEEIDAALQPFTGAERTLADVQRARAALEAAYARRGYGATQVVVPAQEITDGVVRLRAIEGRVSGVSIEGNRFFDAANIRRSLPALVEGQPLNTARLARELRLANESPVKQTTTVLKGGAEEGDLTAQVRVEDQRPWRFSLGLDNTGTPETGEHRIGVGFQHANLFDRDHVLTLQYVTSPGKEDNPDKFALPPNDNVLIAGAGYHIPLYSLGDSIDLVAGYANVDSGVVQNLFAVSGSGWFYGARYNFGLPTAGAFDQKLSLGFDWRIYNNDVALVGSTGSITPDYTIHPLSLAYSGAYRAADQELAFSVAGVQNIPGGNDGTQATFDAVRPGAPASYTLARATLSYLHGLPRGAQARVRLAGQYTRDELVPGEQFGIGGMDSVRGFFERQYAGDRGYSGSLELYSPDFGADLLPPGPWRARVLAFYDFGRAYRINPEVFEPEVIGISSVGPGLRIAYGSSVTLRFDYGFQIQRGEPPSSFTSRANFSLVWVF